MACKLTIIMPAFNASGTIEAAVHSICGQTMDDIQILLVDDGSLDKTLKMMKELGDMDWRVQVMVQEHAGAGAARNAALAKAEGKYVYFADADDVMHDQAAGIMVNKMEETGADLLTFGYRQIRSNNKVTEISAEEDIFDGSVIRSDFTAYTSGSACKVLGSCWNKCFRMDLIRKFDIRFPELTRNEEEVFIMRYLEHAGKIVNIPDVLYDYYPIGIRQAWTRLPDDFCDQVDIFRRIRLIYAKRWQCDNEKTRGFIASEYWGKMLLGLRLCFIPGRNKGYREFSARCEIFRKGLRETVTDTPGKLRRSLLCTLVRWHFTPLAYLWVRGMK